MKKFVILLGSEAQNQIIDFQKYANENRLEWWHWLPNSLLIIDRSGTYTAASLNKALNITFPSVYKLVIQVGENSRWAGFGPSSGERNMFEWLKSSWKD